MMLPNEDCPRFIRCSVNNCPLHPEYPNLSVSPLDKERTCKLAKSYRVKIASNYPGVLKYEGLTKHEYMSKIAWENRNPEDKEKTLKTLKKYGFSTVSQNELSKVDTK